ncbi:DUF5305 domain-containing protein [Halobacterium yunchengense]|uniref:DUF5305 domain-containing protein n=1 Tax=Halobacterium yunchengense TaxID=3108497 RepID=UPI00300A7EB0
MGQGTRGLEVRAVASSWSPVLVVVLAACVVVGGWAAATAHVAPGTTEQQSERAHWTVSGEFDHSAEVTRENPVFEEGATLENRETYFVRATPVLDGEFAAEYTSVAGDSADLAVDTALVVRAVEDGTVYWTDRVDLASTTADGVASGESASVSFSLNASELADRRAEIEQSLGQSPGETEAFVAATVTAEGTAGGEQVTESLTHRLPVSVDGDTYAVESPGSTSETATTAETVTVQREYGPLWALGGPLLFMLGAGGLGALAVAHRRDALALSAAERDYLEYSRERDEFDEWVVSVRLPASVRDRPRADADSLADLVDFAIDTDAGVVEDPETGRFYAVGDDLVVAYDPPSPPAERDGGIDAGSVLAAVTGGRVSAGGTDGESAVAADPVSSEEASEGASVSEAEEEASADGAEEKASTEAADGGAAVDAAAGSDGDEPVERGAADRPGRPDGGTGVDAASDDRA